MYVSGKPAALNNAKKDARMYAFIYSTPQQLKGEDGHDYVTVRADENGKYYFKAMIPAGLTGKHTILLMDADGSQLASGEVTVSAAHVADVDTQSDNMPASKKPAEKKPAESKPAPKKPAEKKPESKPAEKKLEHTGQSHSDSVHKSHSDNRSFTKKGKNASGSVHASAESKSDATEGDENHESTHAATANKSDSIQSETNGATDNNSANNSAGADAGNSSKEQTAERTTAKELTSKLAATGSGVVAAVVTFLVLMVSGAITFTTRRHGVHAGSNAAVRK